ncbi:MAG TPA: spermidine synthase [Thermoanaerobaculia bacterium]|nr:spermidine synthase [Thermoanaerobaculia bacterium]
MTLRTTNHEQRITLHLALSGIFFLSGGASLLFETLWFRECGLVFGNSAWASAIVLGAFMAGLAIGNLIAPGLRAEPLRVYAAIEITIGVCGFLLVLVLPLLSPAFAPLFRHLLDSPMLNAARLVGAFVLLVIPATGMGATLPTLVRALSRRDESFGRVLGLLYGFNTIGAVAGALAGELILIRALGVRGTGAFAALCSITAGVLASRLRGAGSQPAQSRFRSGSTPIRFLLAAACSGFALLALEVIWFRFVLFFVVSTSIAFAVMLAVVLAGIGIGALIASTIWNRFPDADAYTPVVAAGSAAALVLCYSGFSPMPVRHLASSMFIDGARLMLPVSILSGILFTFIGRALEREINDESRAAALVTFANTVGAAFGPLVAGFALIPSIGIEASFFAIGVLYVVVALLTMRSLRVAIAAAAIASLTLVFFPWHLWRNYFLPLATHPYRQTHIVAVSEAPTETAVYLEEDIAGDPYVYTLYTNGFSMSGTAFPSRRYMSMFVYLPIALRPQTKSALLISYGVGITAKTLTRTKQLESIDVVDISRSILDHGRIIWPGASYPLADPRVHVHVEDGRFFLLATPKRFDLITAEPPPPKNAGIVNLYTREYFQLMHDRLTDRGIASYWLPAYQMSQSDNLAIIRAFCDVFDDCSLWTGARAEWILVGSRGADTAPSEEDFSRQWSDPATRASLVRIGVERPDQMATTFLADAPILERLTANAKPLTDDHPLRLSAEIPVGLCDLIYEVTGNAPRAFLTSDFIRRILPPRIRAAAPSDFRAQQVFDATLYAELGMKSPRSPELVRALVTQTNLRALPRLVMGSDFWLEDIALRARARGSRDPYLAYIAAVGALSDHDFARARDLFAEARRGLPKASEIPQYEALASSLAR